MGYDGVGASIRAHEQLHTVTETQEEVIQI